MTGASSTCSTSGAGCPLLEVRRWIVEPSAPQRATSSPVGPRRQWIGWSNPHAGQRSLIRRRRRDDLGLTLGHAVARDAA